MFYLKLEDCLYELVRIEKMQREVENRNLLLYQPEQK